MKQIAVVEDTPDNALLLTALLEDRYSVRVYEDGVKALADMPLDIPSLILLDISLPRMDGVQVLSNIRADTRLQHVPVVALTAHDSVGDRERFAAAGFDDYLSKPILDEAEVYGTIDRWI